MKLPPFERLRSYLLFYAGLAGVVEQTVQGLLGIPPNAELLVVFGTMMGLPAFMKIDDKKGGGDK